MPPPPPPPAAAATEVMEEEGTDDEETEEEEEEEEEEETEEEEEDEEEYDVDHDGEEDGESEDEEESSEEEEGGNDRGEEECRENVRRGGAGLLSAAATAVVEEHGCAEAAAGPSCCVCMEPWDCDGAHRICCIPCGHVYGRSCLERWLRRCGNTSAKCPQCGQRFRHKHITNLYVSGNVWDGFCRLQLQEFVTQLTQLRSEVGKYAKLRADMESDMAKAHAELTAVVLQFKNDDKQSSCEESAHQDAAAVVEAEFLSMKEQLRKMAGEQNATPMDMLRFMEQNGAKLWESIGSRPPAATTTVED